MMTARLPDCPLCSGEACDLCGTGCWSDETNCQHDQTERHKVPMSKQSDNTLQGWADIIMTTQNNTDDKQGEAPERIWIQPQYFNRVMPDGIYHKEPGPRTVEYVRSDLASRASVAAVEGDAGLYQVASRVLHWLYATMNPKCGDKSLMSVTQFEIHAELERALLNAHAAQVYSRIAAAASSPAPASPVEPWRDEGGHAWEIKQNVTCVECPHCCFIFAAEHTSQRFEVDQWEGYDCPNCEGCPDAATPPTTPSAAAMRAAEEWLRSEWAKYYGSDIDEGVNALAAIITRHLVGTPAVSSRNLAICRGRSDGLFRAAPVRAAGDDEGEREPPTSERCVICGVIRPKVPGPATYPPYFCLKHREHVEGKRCIDPECPVCVRGEVSYAERVKAGLRSGEGS